MLSEYPKSEIPYLTLLFPFPQGDREGRPYKDTERIRFVLRRLCTGDPRGRPFANMLLSAICAIVEIDRA